MGWTISDSDGATLLQGSLPLAFAASPLVAEAVALKETLKAAKSNNLSHLICFSDSKGLIKLITGNSSVIALQGILHDIGVLSNSFSSIMFKFLPRSYNVVADGLAKEALFLFQNSVT